MAPMYNNITIQEINLKDDIEFLIKSFKAKKIYLFGSRGYKTGSTRSDIDIIIDTDKSITMVDFDGYYSNHKYLDLFCLKGKNIQSIITGATIITKPFQGIKALNPILLWSDKKGYCNQDYYIQSIFAVQSFCASAMPHSSNYTELKKMINRICPSNEVQLYFQEAFVNYSNDSYISCISMLGCACESVVNELILACKKKNIVDNPTDTLFDRDITNATSAKKRLEGINNYCVNIKTYLKSNGFSKTSEHFAMFDIIRNYRNNADHPTRYDFTKEDCEMSFAAIKLHIEEIYKIIQHINSNY